MLLAVDVGNTVTHYGLFKGEKLYVKNRVPPMFSEAVVCSVVPEKTPVFKKPTLIVNHKLDLGLKIKYKNPGDVGTDRLADAVAVKFIYGYPAIIIDFGTAITIDAISKTGDFIGGIILPGINMIRQGLNEKTALLPLVPLGKPKRILGRTTKGAIRSGLYYGIRAMIRQLVNDLKKELRFGGKTVIINTGGNADFLASGRIDKYLTLKGLRIIYERNRNNGSAFICKQ